MSNTTQKTQLEQSNTSENVENVNRENSSAIHGSYNVGEPLINEEVPGTPFRLVGDKEHGYALTLGKNRLTEPRKNKDEIINELMYVDWNLIANMIVTVIKAYDEMEEGNIKKLDNI